MHAYTCTHADVVRAYKSVLKEKEALEASIRAISSHTGGGGISEGGGGEEGEGGEGEGRPPEDVESGSERRTDESGTEEGRMVEVKLSPEPKEIGKVTSGGYYLLQQVCGAHGLPSLLPSLLPSRNQVFQL